MPYLAIDESRRAILPEGQPVPDRLKAFDFLLYGEKSHLLCELKGRKIAARSKQDPAKPGRLDSWVTLDDVASLETWQGLFGPGYEAAFVFLYWCEAPPPGSLFQETFQHEGRWYAVRLVRLADYTGAMKPRSVRWRTVHLSAAAFEQLSQPLTRTVLAV